MSRGIETALAESLERVERGDATLEEALRLYPELRSELEPLLTLAVELRAMPKPSAPESLRTSKRPVFQAPSPAPVIDLVSRRRRWLPPAAAFGWGAPIARLAAGFAAVLLLAGGTAVASASSLPEEPLYPVKLALEDVQLALASSPQARAELETEFASRRLEEVEKAAGQGKTEAVQRGLALYQEKVDSALASAQAASNLDSGNETQQVEDALKHNTVALSEVLNKVENPVAKEAIQRAIARTEERVESGKSRGNSDHDKKPESEPAVGAGNNSSKAAPSPTSTPESAGAVRDDKGNGNSDHDKKSQSEPAAGTGDDSSTATPSPTGTPEPRGGHEPPGQAKPNPDPGPGPKATEGPGHKSEAPGQQEPKGQSGDHASTQSAEASSAVVATPTVGATVDPIPSGPEATATPSRLHGNQGKDQDSGKKP